MASSDEYGNKVGSKNVYTCEVCGKKLCTVHVDTGVTPYMVLCKRTPGCKGFATSSFYRPTELTPLAEWYRPRPDDPLLKNEGTREHVANGGLLLRMIANPGVKL